MLLLVLMTVPPTALGVFDLVGRGVQKTNASVSCGPGKEFQRRGRQNKLYPSHLSVWHAVLHVCVTVLVLAPTWPLATLLTPPPPTLSLLRLRGDVTLSMGLRSDSLVAYLCPWWVTSGSVVLFLPFL